MKFHLHARLLVGPLTAPVRNQTRESTTDRWEEVEQWVCQQVEAGFTVWVYDHGHQTPIPFASDLRRIAWAKPGEDPQGITMRIRPSWPPRDPGVHSGAGVRRSQA